MVVILGCLPPGERTILCVFPAKGGIQEFSFVKIPKNTEASPWADLASCPTKEQGGFNINYSAPLYIWGSRADLHPFEPIVRILKGW
jgi:hypothetical protein